MRVWKTVKCFRKQVRVWSIENKKECRDLLNLSEYERSRMCARPNIFTSVRLVTEKKDLCNDIRLWLVV